MLPWRLLGLVGGGGGGCGLALSSESIDGVDAGWFAANLLVTGPGLLSISPDLMSKRDTVSGCMVSLIKNTIDCSVLA